MNITDVFVLFNNMYLILYSLYEYLPISRRYSGLFPVVLSLHTAIAISCNLSKMLRVQPQNRKIDGFVSKIRRNEDDNITFV